MSISTDQTLGEERVNKLAQANLCRLRGEYDKSEALCVEILQSNPDKVEAMAILGDICAERNDLIKARHWFSMASDIKPPLPGVVEKFNQIDQRIKNEEKSASAVVTIRAAYSRQRTMTWLAVGAAGIALTAALIAGTRRPIKDVIATPIVFAPSPVISTPPSTSKPAASTNPTTSNIASNELVALTQLGRPEVKSIISAELDPRTETLYIVAQFPNDGSERSLSGALGIDGLQSSTKASTVTVQLLSQGEIQFAADVKRSDYSKALGAASGQTSASDPNSTSKSGQLHPETLLSNEWESGESATAGSGTTQEAGNTAPTTN